LIETGEFAKHELIVVVLSGSGLKAADAIKGMMRA